MSGSDVQFDRFVAAPGGGHSQSLLDDLVREAWMFGLQHPAVGLAAQGGDDLASRKRNDFVRSVRMRSAMRWQLVVACHAWYPFGK